MTLHYLDFDYSEDTGGIGTFEAMASTGALQLPALQAEIARVLDWAHAAFAGTRGPVDEGGEWDYDLQAQQEFTVPEHMAYDPDTRRFSVHPGTAGMPRHTVTLSLSGTGGFCDAFRQQFGLAGPA
jgi:hypothetical protein